MNWLPTLCHKQNRCLILQATENFRQELLPGGVFNDLSLNHIIKEVLLAKQTGNRRKPYLSSLQHYLKRFAVGRESQSITSISIQDIEAWLSKYKNPSSRQTWLNRISTLFSFAVRRGYIRENICNRIERVTIDRRPPKILTVEQAKKLLQWCPTTFKPYLILAMFAGVRPQEIERLDWKDINLETKTVRINFAKVQSHRRIVPLEPIAVKYLSEHPLKNGVVCPTSAVLRRWKRKARIILGFDHWPKDIFRHTAASYLIALHENVDRVAKDLGNSRKVLLTHYHEPVTKEQSELFWRQ